MNCESSSMSYDFSVTAALLSQFTGVLTGFAFVAITVILPGSHRRIASQTDASSSQPSGRGGLDANILLPFMTSFVILLLGTFEYSVVAGERECALLLGRANSGQLLAGIIFAFGILNLLHGLVQLVADSDVTGVTVHMKFATAVLAPPILVLFLIIAAIDVAKTPWVLNSGGVYEQGNSGFVAEMIWAYFVLPTTVLIFCVTAFVLNEKQSERFLRATGLLGTRRILLVFPYVSLGLALACTVRATILPGDDPSAHLSDMEVRFALVLSTLTALAASLIALRTRERENRASPAAGDGAAC